MIGSCLGCAIGSGSGSGLSGKPPPCSRPPAFSLRAPSSPGALHAGLPPDAQVPLAESFVRGLRTQLPANVRSFNAPGVESRPALHQSAPSCEGSSDGVGVGKKTRRLVPEHFLPSLLDNP